MTKFSRSRSFYIQEGKDESSFSHPTLERIKTPRDRIVQPMWYKFLKTAYVFNTSLYEKKIITLCTKLNNDFKLKFSFFEQKTSFIELK